MTSGVPFWNHAYLHKETIPAAPLLTFSPGIHRENEMEKTKSATCVEMLEGDLESILSSGHNQINYNGLK